MHEHAVLKEHDTVTAHASDEGQYDCGVYWKREGDNDGRSDSVTGTMPLSLAPS